MPSSSIWLVSYSDASMIKPRPMFKNASSCFRKCFPWTLLTPKPSKFNRILYISPLFHALFFSIKHPFEIDTLFRTLEAKKTTIAKSSALHAPKPVQPAAAAPPPSTTGQAPKPAAGTSIPFFQKHIYLSLTLHIRHRFSTIWWRHRKVMVTLFAMPKSELAYTLFHLCIR